MSKKDIFITHDTLVADIEAAFTFIYPYLKIELYKIAKGTGHLKSIRVDPATPAKQLASMHELEVINVSADRTVAELTHDIEHTLGSIVKISRLSGKVWIAISITDGWTLENQNSAGKYICSEMSLLWPNEARFPN